MEIPVIRNVLEANEKLSARLKEHFARHGILTLNLISSPGAGKTSLLERTLADLSPEFRMAVIEGDLQTDNDAQRVAATGSMPGIKAFTAAVFGGIGSIPGALLGGLLLGIIEIFASAYISTQLSTAVVFGVLIVVLLVKPAGLLGKTVREKV